MPARSELEVLFPRGYSPARLSGKDAGRPSIRQGLRSELLILTLSSGHNVPFQTKLTRSTIFHEGSLGGQT